MTGPELQRLARIVRRTFAKRGQAADDCLGDLDDVEQDAALVMWTTWLRKGEPASEVGFYTRAGVIWAGAGVKDARAVERLTSYARSKGYGHQTRVPLQGCGYADDPTAVDPPGPASAAAAVHVRDAARARQELLLAIRLAGEDALGAQDAARARRMIGLEGRRPSRRNEKPSRLPRRLREAVRRDPRAVAARDLDRQYSEDRP